MYAIIDAYLKDFDMMLNDDIIDCFTTIDKKDIVIKDEITKEEKSTLENMIVDKNTETYYCNKEAKKVKINEYVTGLKIKYKNMPKK